MANFEKNGRNVHGQVLTAPAGKVYELGLYGPIDMRNRTELSVSIAPPNPNVTIKPAGMLPGQNVRVWQFTGLPIGRTLVQAKDSGGIVWTSVTIDTQQQSAFSSKVTKDQLTDKAGIVQAKYPPSPAITALMDLLTKGTNSELKRGVALLESAGRAGNLYEHTAGLALDIYRDAKNEAQRAQAHNLIRFFIATRDSLGWRNMFYEGWGFSRSGLVKGADNHYSHIHIDWMDFSLLTYEGADRFDRSKWTEITWPPEASNVSTINTEANADLVRAAWGNTSDQPLTDDEINKLYL